MKKPCKNRILGALVLLMLIGSGADTLAQRKSEAGKEPTPGLMIKESSLDYRLWEGFTLVRRANDGEAAAQHELGLRYLQGRGFPADTARAALWMQRAAAQDFDLASFNLGILSLNGWGLDWDPFAAFRHFGNASRRGMEEADFLIGLMYTEGLVVRQNWRNAYAFVKKAADKGFDPAKKALKEFQKRGIDAGEEPDSSGRFRPLFIDFDVDTTSNDDAAILNDLLEQGSEDLKEALGDKPITGPPSSSAMAMIHKASDAGSPEARILLARLQEKGLAGGNDPVAAAGQYLVAVRNESPRAMDLLWKLVSEPGFPAELERRAKQGDALAMYVWAGLVAARIDQRLSGEQALKLLMGAVDQRNIEAMIELGLCYQSGRWVPQDRARAIQWWETAAGLGSKEALVRIKAVQLFGDNPVIPPGLAGFFQSEAEGGSILAQVALGYCYERGLGTPRNSGKAARLYRTAAQRGSQSAYEALRRMHDAVRPPGPEWAID